jgi:hypothetical protein
LSIHLHRSLSLWLSHQHPICIPLLPHSFYMPCPSHSPSLDHSNYIWRGVQVMKLLIMQFSPICHHFIQCIIILIKIYSVFHRTRLLVWLSKNLILISKTLTVHNKIQQH